ISLRTMQLLMEETGLCDTVDPMAGSYYMETLTNQMRDKMEEIMTDVDVQGGVVQMIKKGELQAKVSGQAYQMQKDIDSGAFPKVGVNCYRVEEEEEHEVEFHPYNTKDAELQIESLKEIRASRDQVAVDKCLAQLKADAEVGKNVMPAIGEAVKAYGTVGEMTDTMVEIYGRYEEPIVF
ncbi:MAG: methylmalonyl-CoA mutase family protein, partial [Rhodospirillales bacterium]|nr:methylmalonyl-CoA mutase family protein [Rhodospirillales bacterium]